MFQSLQVGKAGWNWTDLDLLNVFRHHLCHILPKSRQLVVSDGILGPYCGCRVTENKNHNTEVVFRVPISATDQMTWQSVPKRPNCQATAISKITCWGPSLIEIPSNVSLIPKLS